MLSQKELEQVYDAEWILSKNRIMEKIDVLFGSIVNEWKLDFVTQQEILDSSAFKQPKISKGEQYHQLPWMAADYPREFKGEDVLLVRCLFWWGHYFALVVHVEGMYQKQIGHLLQTGLDNKGWYFYTGQDKWDNVFSSGHYQLDWKSMDMETSIFLKWMYPIPIQPWNEVEEKIRTAYNQILLSLSPQSVE